MSLEQSIYMAGPKKPFAPLPPLPDVPKPGNNPFSPDLPGPLPQLPNKDPLKPVPKPYSPIPKPLPTNDPPYQPLRPNEPIIPDDPFKKW